MKKICIILLIFVSSCTKENIEATENITCSNQNYTYNNPIKSNRYQTLLDSFVKVGLPGISALVADSSGVWVGSAGMADIQNHVVFTPCHISKAASITKMLVATLTLKLQEEGKINIDEPLDKYIDADILKKIDKAEGKTIRQCLNHSTGIYDVITGNDFYLAVLNNPNKEWTSEDLLKYVYGKRGYELKTDTPAHYSNTNLLLVSMCLEKATNMKHATILRDKILNPLGMSHTFYQGREVIPRTAAQGYYDLHRDGSIVNVSNLITGSGNGYGGIYSSVFDLYTFSKALFEEGKILNSTSLAAMQKFLLAEEDFYTGVGLIKKYTTKKEFGIGHTGKDLGYSANLFYFPASHKTMVFFVNYGTNGKSDLKQVFLNFESAFVDCILL